jgi:hypothetical protein
MPKWGQVSHFNKTVLTMFLPSPDPVTRPVTAAAKHPPSMRELTKLFQLLKSGT